MTITAFASSYIQVETKQNPDVIGILHEKLERRFLFQKFFLLEYLIEVIAERMADSPH
jgi:hypothetical protein